MKVKEIISHLDELAPLAYAESFDNVGLLVGTFEMEVTGVLVTLDTLEATVDEAIAKDCNFIISFHPIVFDGLKRFTNANYVERVVIKAIKNDIAIFAIHTALDNAFKGVNDAICDQLQVKNREILIPQENTIKKLNVYVPTIETVKVQNALFDAGAGTIGNYKDCSFSVKGTGTFTPIEGSHPVNGKIGEFSQDPETKITVTFPRHLQSGILNALKRSTSYEEVAYELTTLENTNQHLGMGMVGNLAHPYARIGFSTTRKRPLSLPRNSTLQITKQAGKSRSSVRWKW